MEMTPIEFCLYIGFLFVHGEVIIINERSDFWKDWQAKVHCTSILTEIFTGSSHQQKLRSPLGSRHYAE